MATDCRRCADADTRAIGGIDRGDGLAPDDGTRAAESANVSMTMLRFEIDSG